MTKKSFLYTLVLLLIVINTIALFVFWRSTQQIKKPDNKRPATYLIEKTGMDSVQKSRYQDLIAEHQKSTQELRKQIRQFKDEYFDLVGKNAPDSTRKMLLQKISSFNESLDEVTFLHFEKVRAILNPAQQEKFDKAIQNVLRKMSAPPRGPRPGPPPHERIEGPGQPADLKPEE